MAEVLPKCAVFGECGGCEYQNISYEKELKVKESALKELFQLELRAGSLVEPILPSPRDYHYRHRLDLSLRKTRKGIFVGFTDKEIKYVVDINACPIAMEPVSEMIPNIKKKAIEILPEKYRTATITVKTGDEGKVYWGGIGRRSLRQEEKDYLWTEVQGKRIHFSLETFFQANLAILPKVIETVRSLPVWQQDLAFYDLYSGVGLFGLCLEDKVKKVVMIEDSKHSNKCAEYNIEYHKLDHVQTHCGPAEELFQELFEQENEAVVMVDPPRMGLKETAVEALNKQTEKIKTLLYLSCHPETLLRDIKLLTGYKINKVIPMDFFPKTTHIETLVWMQPK